ncbi:hypothetical protein ZIOFF_020534 [Zingiber officinale]|uniref:Protein kinase domain-containing protein n=1 Tax=Zingiber officinale TaxID=94328 RepID=A0A8J5H5T0_ZINOF|nr:hypothetical protein ZIOFF_020534 [Zingiber officinale]
MHKTTIMKQARKPPPCRRFRSLWVRLREFYTLWIPNGGALLSQSSSQPADFLPNSPHHYHSLLFTLPEFMFDVELNAHLADRPSGCTSATAIERCRVLAVADDMAGGEKHGSTTTKKKVMAPVFFSLLILISPPILPYANAAGSSAQLAPVRFSPIDNYLIDCGSPKMTQGDDGRFFRSESQSSSYLSTKEDIKIAADNSTAAANSTDVPLLYLTARVFPEESKYSFFISKPGRHWIRLYFFPFPNAGYNLTAASFTVRTDDLVLLQDFNPSSATTPPASPLLKEYLIEITEDRVSLIFCPKKGRMAFVNAIEVVSAPDKIIANTATSISPQVEFTGLRHYSLEATYRINAGGPEIAPQNDTLSRTWRTDAWFLKELKTVQNVSVAARKIKFPEDESVTPLIAPSEVYASAQEMANANTDKRHFNITWQFAVDPSFSYLIRLHFCDIVSKNLNELYFNVYINGLIGVSSLDLSTATGDLSVAYFKDFVANASTISNKAITIQVGPPPNSGLGTPNAILNGIEVMKMSNSAGSLDGQFSADGSYHGGSGAVSLERRIVSGVGLVLGAVAMVLVVMMFCRWRRRPAEWRKINGISSWLLPVHMKHRTYGRSSGSSKGSSRDRFGSNKCKSGYANLFPSGAMGVGRIFSLGEMKEATNNFDEKAVVGVGGFGKVYLGEFEGTKVAIKRGNPSSEQGINEFQAEIQMLSKLRHRHLVSLIGCCYENKEMILVYEYMSKGPLRDHLYGNSGQTPLSWKQRLEVCIGAARGLHYLHTGASHGIIHRDVKTTNILLDENLVAKMADFGLSKAAPSLEQTHVSTAVKGSFGYLDPEYFRRQQLTEKSDVYSFGVVLFEVLCGRAALNPALPRDQVNLAEWAMQWHRRGQLEKIVDPHIASTISPASLKKYVESAEKCLADCGVDRPSMGDVLWSLEYALQLQEAGVGQQAVDDTTDESATHIPLDGGPVRLRDDVAATCDDGAANGDDESTLMSNPLCQGR